MVDIVTNLTNQLLLERFRAGSLYSGFDSRILNQRAFQAWDALLLAYGNDAPQKLVDISFFSSLKEATVPKIKPSQLLALGISLTEVNQDFILVKDTSNMAQDSLLNLACGLLLWGDRDEGLKLLEELRGDKWKELIVLDEWKFYTHSGWPNPTYPEMFDTEPFEFGDYRFGLNQLSWMAPTTAGEIIKKSCGGYRHNLGYFYALSQYHEGRWNTELQKLAESQIRNEMNKGEKKKRIQYQDMALALRLCSKRFFCHYLSSVKGSRLALGVVRDDVPEHYFQRGLGKLNADNILDALGPWVARPLELNDLVRIRGVGLVQLLWRLPWELVEPLATKHRSKVVPKTVGALDKMDYREKHRECLSDHPKRLKRGDDSTRLQDKWEEHIKPIIERYEASRKFRKIALDTGLTRDQILFMLLLKGENYLEEMVEELPIWPTIEKLMSLIPKHLPDDS